MMRSSASKMAHISRRRAVALLADVEETSPEEASSWALPLARCYWQRVRRVSQQLLNSCLVRSLAGRKPVNSQPKPSPS